MSTEIEEIESEEQVTHHLEIEQTQLLNDTSSTTVAESLDIEEINTQRVDLLTLLPAKASTAARPKSSTNWVAGNSNTHGGLSLDGRHQTASKVYEGAVRQRGRSSTGLSRPFVDLPRQLAEAVARLQSTRSMHTSLATSAVYASRTPGKGASRTLLLKIHQPVYSCGNNYVEAECDQGERYVVHVPSTIPKENLLRGKCLLLEEPYIRRRLSDAWLVSLITRVKIID